MASPSPNPLTSRYEELKTQLDAAQANAEREEEEAELARAAAAVARLTAPELPTPEALPEALSSRDAAEKVRAL